MEDASASPLSVSGISVPQTDPATSETLGFPNPTGPTERGEIELSIESWNGVVPQALASLMPEEMVNFLIKYPSLEVAVKAGAVGAWNQVVEWVRLRISGEQWRSPQQDAQSLEIVGEGVGEARGEVVPTLPEIVGEGVGEARGEVVPTLPPARTFDPSDGMGMNASLANAGSFPATGGIISSPSTPPTEENLRNLEILESLKKQGSFGNKVEPEVVNLAPVGQIASQPSTSPDTSSKADAKKQVLEIVAAMEQANIGKEVIRKELLRLLGIIKPADYNSSYARALAEVYFEFTKESN
jgi:hypothetical protein